MLLTVTYVGHAIDVFTVKAIQPKIEAKHKFFSPTTKTELRWLIGSINFYPKIIDKFHVFMKGLYDLLHDKVELHWDFQLEALFRQKKKLSLTKAVLRLYVIQIIPSLLM